MPTRTILHEILRLDPEKDCRRIVFLDTFHEFPWDTTRSLEFALFRTFASPRISALLDKTGEFTQRTQRRNDDTELILSEVLEHGPDSPRGRGALRLMNRQHGKYPIPNDDFLYVMSTFIFEPIRWNARFGWRPMVEQEKLAAYHYWRMMGRHMHIQHVPESYAEFETFNRDYERANFRYSPTNRRVATATRDMFLGWYLPAPLRRLGIPGFVALLDDSLLAAFHFPKAPTAVRVLVETGLKARARVLRRLPERRKPKLRTGMHFPSYPHGYQLEQLGPPPPPV